jgi:hypothetical protein
MKWVCVCKIWDKFTYGKVYEGELNSNGTLLDVKNDLGESCLPAFFRKVNGDKKYYFIEFQEWRQIKLNKILNK